MQVLDPGGRTVQFISGAGGYSHTSPDANDPRLRFGDGTHYGALRLTLAPRIGRWAFIATDGTTLDSGVMRCRKAAS
jgi:hypothetical protein